MGMLSCHIREYGHGLMMSRVTDLIPQDSEQNPFYYTFKVQCTSCREVHPNWVSVSRHVSHHRTLWTQHGLSMCRQEQNEQSGSRGEANFVWRCKNCKVCLHCRSGECEKARRTTKA